MNASVGVIGINCPKQPQFSSCPTKISKAKSTLKIINNKIVDGIITF